MYKSTTNVESLVLTDLVSTSASLTYINSSNANLNQCNSNVIITQELSCTVLDIPTNIPTQYFTGTMYYDPTSNRLYIYDGNDNKTLWNYVTLTVV